MAPRWATILRTTSMAPLYAPFSAVCRLTLTRSKGWPVSTAHTPPTPPATRARREVARSDVVLAGASASAGAEAGGGAGGVPGLGPPAGAIVCV
jgi:hypothetical protein